MGTWVYEPPGRCYELTLGMKAEEGSSDGNLFYGMRTAEWADHAEEHPTIGVTDSEDDNTVRAGVSKMSSNHDNEDSTFDKEDDIPDDGYRDNRIDDDEKFEDLSAGFLALGYDPTQVHVFDVPLAYR